MIIFAVSNRNAVTVSLFPLPYELQIPLFLLALVAFAGGVIAAWLSVSLKLSRIKHLSHRAQKKIVALENQIKATRIETQALATVPEQKP